MEEQLIAIFCDIDEFLKEYEKYLKDHLLTDKTHKVPKTSMEMSYIMTIVVFFHLSNHRYFKWYYKDFICGDPRVAGYFGKVVSYNRFIELMPSVAAPLTLYMMKGCFGKCTGISFLDSTTLEVCHTHRIHSHRVFDGLAKKGKSSTGWFFGFKLHITINYKGEIIAFCLTPGNVDDRDWNVISKLTREMFGKILLRKRAVIESVNDFLKNICQIEHSRHRSLANFLFNVISGLVAYSFLPKNPSLHISNDFVDLSSISA